MKNELARTGNVRAFKFVYNLFMTVILGIKLAERLDVAIEFQKIVSQFGCIIQTRLGLHRVNERFCSSFGLILLEVVDDKQAALLEKELLHIDKIEIQRMIFS